MWRSLRFAKVFETVWTSPRPQSQSADSRARAHMTGYYKLLYKFPRTSDCTQTRHPIRFVRDSEIAR